MEDGTSESSGLKELFEQHVKHITDNHKAFFQHWYRLVCLEVRHSRHDNKEALWAQDTGNQYATIVRILIAWYGSCDPRLENGLCVDHLTAGQIVKQSDGSILQTLHCSK